MTGQTIPDVSDIDWSNPEVTKLFGALKKKIDNLETESRQSQDTIQQLLDEKQQDRNTIDLMRNSQIGICKILIVYYIIHKISQSYATVPN